MKKRTLSKQLLKLVAVISGVLVMVFFVFSISPAKEKIPASLVGNWSGKQIVKVRYKQGFLKYIFVKSPDSLTTNIKIDENGTVSGKFGAAVFKDCSIQRNRGALGRKLNLATDYRIRGKLAGFIFQKDTISIMEISMPFTYDENNIKGDVFQLLKIDLYPMAGINLRKGE